MGTYERERQGADCRYPILKSVELFDWFSVSWPKKKGQFTMVFLRRVRCIIKNLKLTKCNYLFKFKSTSHKPNQGLSKSSDNLYFVEKPKELLPIGTIRNDFSPEIPTNDRCCFSLRWWGLHSGQRGRVKGGWEDTSLLPWKLYYWGSGEKTQCLKSWVRWTMDPSSIFFFAIKVMY